MPTTPLDSLSTDPADSPLPWSSATTDDELDDLARELEARRGEAAMARAEDDRIQAGVR